jgi:hypothetical protein
MKSTCGGIEMSHCGKILGKVCSIVLAAALMAATLAVPAGAQLETGNLYGIVTDEQGNAVAGAAVLLTGGGAPQERKSDENGAFRFIGLAPGSYGLVVSRQQFTTMEYPDLSVSVGRNSQVAVTLQSALNESITVSADAPLLDERQVAAGASVTRTELEKIPTARDPWALLSSVPGVLVDRVNVGGNFSGSQSNFVGPGSMGSQTVWSLDGMVITDMTAVGSAPGYFDFESFEEVQVTTGGSDASQSTGGVAINMVTRRGNNDWRGSAHAYYADESFVSGLNLDGDKLAPASAANRFRAQPSFKAGNRINRVQDVGAELGGPLVRDHFWAWGSYTQPETHLLTINDYEDNTDLRAWNLKLNGQLTPANAATFFAWNDEKTKRGIGASPLHPPETTLDQSRFGQRPTALKLQDTHIFGSSLYLDGMASKVNGGFQQVPEGGELSPYQDDNGVWHNSYFVFKSSRPQKQVRVNGSGFFNTGKLAHELKFGSGYRVVEVDSLSRTPGGGYSFGSDGLLLITRDGHVRFRGEYSSAFLQDTLAAGQLTANIGVRYDRQTGKNLALTLPANPVFPDLLPAVSYAGGEVPFQWTDAVPRLGVTWAVDQQRRTLLRASYSRYADQLDTSTAGWTNPLQIQQYLYYYTANPGSPVLSPDDLLGPSIGQTSGINPLTGGALASNAIDPGLQAPVVDEVILGLDHGLRPDLVVGLQGIYKHYTKILDYRLLVLDDPDAYSPESLATVGRKVRPDDYIQGGTLTSTGPDGQPYSIPYFVLRPEVSSRGGLFLENGPREQVYKALIVTLNKRLANRWMLRGNMTWNDWRWRIPKGAITEANTNVLGGNLDGTLVVSGRDVVNSTQGSAYINSKWSYALNGLYQVAPERPWGFNVAASLTGRQGYPMRYVRRLFIPTINIGRPSDMPTTTRVDAFRYPDVHVLNLRLDKEVRFKRTGATFGVDVFNALNSATVVRRQLLLGGTNGDYLLETLGQRVYRLSLRLDIR